MPTLQTPRLLLRSFAAHDLDKKATLMADKDFMRFSLGVFSREQTAGFLDKMRARDRHRLPSQFGVTFREDERLIGYCGVAEKNGMTPEKETTFRGFPTIVFSLHPTKGNGA